jgi:hypothetical protein
LTSMAKPSRLPDRRRRWKRSTLRWGDGGRQFSRPLRRRCRTARPNHMPGCST